VDEFPYRLVTIDIDGTLTIGHGWQFLAERLGRRAMYEETNRAFHEGRESEEDHLRRLLHLAEGEPLARIEELLEETPKIAGISETVQAIRALGATPALLSHNPGYVTSWYAKRFGFARWDGTSDRPRPEVVDGKVAAPGRIRPDKPGGLARLLAALKVPAARAIHIGDGEADAVVFPLVGFGIALNSTIPAVERSADLSLHLTDLRQLLPALPTTLRRSPEP
jgi:phosphoserine phosphatase